MTTTQTANAEAATVKRAIILDWMFARLANVAVTEAVPESGRTAWATMLETQTFDAASEAADKASDNARLVLAAEAAARAIDASGHGKTDDMVICVKRAIAWATDGAPAAFRRQTRSGLTHMLSQLDLA